MAVRLASHQTAFVGFVLILTGIAVSTGLDWPLFRDEPMYVEAIKAFADGPFPTFSMNICGPSIFVWGMLTKAVGLSIPLLRLATLFLGTCGIGFLCGMTRRMPGVKSLWPVWFVCLLPQFVIYCFQINGSAVAFTLTCAVLFFGIPFLHVPCELSPRQRQLNGIALTVFMSLACMQNPFCLSFPLAFIAFEGWAFLKGGKSLGSLLRAPQLWIALCAIGGWLAFVAITQVSLLDSFDKHSRAGINPKWIVLYPGTYTILLIYLGGLFPFLPFALRDRPSLKVLLMIVAVCAILGWSSIPEPRLPL